MKVYNMKSKRTGRSIPNQFIANFDNGNQYFQSYYNVIGMKTVDGKIYFNRETWNYSRTTAKYRNQWLGEDTKTIKAKIKSGEYTLTDLNGLLMPYPPVTRPEKG